jgi:monoamine oxidase
MGDNYSPYHYVDLSSNTWDARSDELVEIADQNGRPNPEIEVVEQLFSELVEALFAFPDHLRDVETSPNPKSICVIGGGIAGLTAAYELTARGHGVTLLEASDRFGGRIRTHHFRDGTHAELGAMRIPTIHGCVSHYVDRFGLRRRPFVSHNAMGYLWLRGGGNSRINGLDDPMEYESLLARYLLDDSKDWMLKIRHPFDYVDKLFEQFGVALGASELESIFKDFEIPPGRLELLEQLSLAQALKGEPVSVNGVTLSNEGIEMIGRSTGMLWFEQVSCLQWLLNELALREPSKYELEGGMESLTDAFLREITTNEKDTAQPTVLHKEALVRELRHGGGRVEVLWESADRIETQKFDFVICTAPAAAAARITFDPPLPPRQYEALTNLTYASAGKTIIRCTERFWELNDGIYGGGSFSDLPHQQCWYPADNTQAANNARLKFGPIRSRGQAIDWRLVAAEKSRQTAVFTAAYLWGANARRFAALDEGERSKLILSSVQQVHPDLRAYIEDVDADVIHCAWDNEASPGNGAFAFFAPGEQSRYQAALCQPHFIDSAGYPRLFFAGEHLGIAHAWIQSSVQTALCAVTHVLRGI